MLLRLLAPAALTTLLSACMTPTQPDCRTPAAARSRAAAAPVVAAIDNYLHDCAAVVNPTGLALAYERRAQAYALLERHDAAAADLGNLLELDPGNLAVRLARAFAYLRANDVAGAHADATEIVRRRPDLPRAHAVLGSVFVAQKKYEEAIRELSIAIHLDPSDPGPRISRAVAYTESGQLEQALADYELALALQPDDFRALGGRGNLFAQRGEADKAIADLSRAIDLQPGLSSLYMNRGAAYLMSGRLEAALADYDRALQLTPDRADALADRGRVQTLRGNREAAVADLTRAIELEPDVPRHRLYRAFNLQALGYATLAHADAERVVTLTALHGGDHSVANNLAWSLATSAEPARRNGALAVKLATLACEQTGWQQAGAVDTLAAAYAETQDFARAVEWQQKALVLARAQSSDLSRLAGFEERLRLYEQKQPLRLTPAAAAGR